MVVLVAPFFVHMLCSYCVSIVEVRILRFCMDWTKIHLLLFTLATVQVRGSDLVRFLS